MGGHSPESFIPAAADDMLVRLAMKANAPIREVVALAETRDLWQLFDADGKLIVRTAVASTAGEEHRRIKPRTERRGISGRRARQITEACYRTTLGNTYFMSLTDKRNWLHDHKYSRGEDPEFQMTTADKKRMLEAMRTTTARRRRSGREALLGVDRMRLRWY